jgi:hypothetical protein
MTDTQNNEFLNGLLNLMTSRVHRRRRQNRVYGSGGQRIIAETIDDTGVGNQNETDNLIIKNTYILDCGHASNNNLGGQCHYCDGLICVDCISICSSCGHCTCKLHTIIVNIDGQNKSYCKSCASEISRKLKLRSTVKTVLSFFFSGDEE